MVCFSDDAYGAKHKAPSPRDRRRGFWCAPSQEWPAFRALLGLAGAVLLFGGCARATPSLSPLPDASKTRRLGVRVPAALSVGRALDALSVTIDPAGLALMEVDADVGMSLGVETEAFVFPRGQARPVRGKKNLAVGSDFGHLEATWTSERDGVPVPGTNYVVEISFILFETDTLPAPDWDPHAGRYQVLWTRSLRQSEE